KADIFDIAKTTKETLEQYVAK
ncbi:hypothetical protein GASC598B02_000080, partial [Gilliamella apicola SCGC AB-598-B02]